MTDDAERERMLLDEVRRRRALLLEQIRQSKLTIERSTELLKQIDKIIAQAEKKH
jgi:hypothetical protein